MGAVGGILVAGSGVKVLVAAEVGEGVSVKKRVGGRVNVAASVTGVKALKVGCEFCVVGVTGFSVTIGVNGVLITLSPSRVIVGCKPGRGVGVGRGATNHKPPPIR